MSELWITYQKSPNEQLRRQLIEQFAPLAKYVVDRLHLPVSSGIGYDDLIGQAIIGLIEAIDRFDPARGIKFNTFAYYRIRGAVMDMLREFDWMPRSLRAKGNDLLGAVARLEGEVGRTPSDQEIANALGISLREFDELAQEVRGQVLLSMDEAIEQSHADGSVYLGDVIADENTISPPEYTEMQDQKRRLAEAIEQLSTNERLTISLYYSDGLTLKEIGKVLGVTESRICQIHAKALIRLRATVNAEEKV